MHAPRSEAGRARVAWLGALCSGLVVALAIGGAARLLAPDHAAAKPKAPRAAASAMPGVHQLCDAIQSVPRRRRAECSGHAPGISLSGECARTLDAAVASGALRFSAPAAERCVAGLRARYADCSFTAARALPPLPECAALWQGTRAAGASCRSSLECGAGMHCQGAGPLDSGVCAAPLPDGAPCELAIDPLASYLPHVEGEHPECAHACVQGRCTRASPRTQRE